MSAHVVIVQSRRTGYVFETYGPLSTSQAEEVIQRLSTRWRDDYRIERHELLVMPPRRKAQVTS